MNIKCSICLELFTENCEVKTTPCGHLFHSLCLERAIQTNENCPQCTVDFLSIGIASLDSTMNPYF